MTPIRILHMIGSLDIGGSQIMILNLYEAIDRTKIQFDFIIDHPEQIYLADRVKRLGAKIYVMPTYKGTNSIEIIKAWDDFFDKHAEYKILHSHVRSYASLYLPIAKKHGLRTIIHSHSISNGSGVQSIVKKFFQYPLRYQADYFFGCSEMAGRWLFGNKVVQSERYYMMKNAIDVDKYALDDCVRAKYRQELGLKDKLVYIHVGRFHPAKNHRFLMKLFSKLHQTNRNAILVLVGDGELRNDIESYIEELDIQDSVLLLGSRNDVCNLLMAADVFLFPSLWEGFPLTVLEAQASGLPCFVSANVPTEVGVTSVVKYISIDAGIEDWVEITMNSNLSRKDVSRELQEAGFDINTCAIEMEKFYISIDKNM